MSDSISSAVASAMMVDVYGEDVPTTSTVEVHGTVPMECDVLMDSGADDRDDSPNNEEYETDEEEFTYLDHRFEEPADNGLELQDQVGCSKGTPIVASSLYQATWLCQQSTLNGKAQEHTYRLQLVPGAATKMVDNSELFSTILKDMVARHAERINEPAGFYVGLKVSYSAEDLQSNKELTDQSFGVAFKPVHLFNAAALKNQIAARAQSGKSSNMFTPNAKLDVCISTMPYQAGSGRSKNPLENLINKQAIDPVIKKRDHSASISSKSKWNITVNGATELCLGVALVQAMAYNRLKMTPKDHIDYTTVQARWARVATKVNRKPSKALIEEGRQLLRSAYILQNRTFPIEEDVPKLQKKLADDYNIVIMGSNGRDSPLFIGSRDPTKEVLAVMLKNKHYQHIKSLPAFMYSRFYCITCDVRGNNRMTHYKCPQLCRKCMTTACPSTLMTADDEPDMNGKCPDCGIWFNDLECFQRHKVENGPLGTKSVCQTTKICPKCSDSYYTSHGDKHVCGQSYCHRCKTTREPGHQCFMSIQDPPKRTSWKRRFFDLETEIVVRDGQKFHEVIAAVALKSCEICMGSRPNSLEEAKSSTCDACCSGGPRLKIFECVTPANRGCNVIQDFTAWLHQPSHAGYSVVAPNLKGYDGQFLLREMALNSEIHDPALILCNGAKILGMKMRNEMRMVDSFSFIPFGLAKFAKSFSVEDSEIAKGHFPYGMLRREFFDYDGPFPSFDLFGTETKSKAQAAEVRKYHQKMVNAGARFNFAEELIRYCVSDVLVLNAGMSKFEKKFYDKTDVILLQESFTAAGGAIKAFRRKFLQPESIALDSHPVAQSMNQSAEAARYLHYRTEVDGVEMHTKWKGALY